MTETIGMLIVNITYHAGTRLMEITSLSSGENGDNAIATTGDNLTTRLQFTFDDPQGTLIDFGKRVDFGVLVTDTSGHTYNPFILVNEEGYVDLPAEILSNVKCGILPIELVFLKVDEITGEDIIIQSLNRLNLAINKAIGAEMICPTDLGPHVDDAISEASYDDATATFTFTRLNGSAIIINLSDLSEEHYEVQHYADLDTLTEAESGDTATVLDTGIWYKLYIQRGIRNWFPMSGNTTINGTQTGTPVFYAPYLSGTSGEYLESRGENQSPEWVTKVTEIDEDSNALPTVTAVKNYVANSVADEAYEREMADGSLKSDIGLEKERAMGAEGLLQQGVEFAMSSITRVENELGNAIITEKNRAEGVEGTLDDKIDKEISDRATAITQAVGAESAERESADRTLEEAISREAGVRASADTGLSDRIFILETETVDDGGRYLTKTDRTLDHDLTTRSNSTDTAILTNGGTATFIDLLTSNETGHVTASNVKTVTLPKVTAGTGITVTNDDLPSPDTGKAIIVGHTNNIAPNTSDVGDATTVPIIRNDSEGHLTKVDSVLIDIPTSQVTKLTGYAEASSEGQLNINDTLNQALGKIQKGINSKAKTNHADGTTQYGQATTSLYGHVKIITATNTPPGTSNENVPTEAKMAEFVNSSIASQTGKFIGTVDAETDLGLTLPTTDTLIANALLTYYQSSSPTNNDYCYVTVDTEPSTPSKDEFRRFKYNGTSWQYEYTLNNSSFTQTQWATINSLLTNRSYGTGNEISLDVVDIDANITASTTHIADTDIHVTTQNKTDWDAKYDKPSTGIPKTDLAQSVQDSLGLADSSLQAHQPIKTINSTTMVGTGNINLQVPLVGSGTGQNIKTVGGTNILGTGDINPVTKTAIESALNVSATYNNQALIVKNGVLDFGEAGKVDEIQINGTKIAPLTDSKVANIVTGTGLTSSSNTIKVKLASETNATDPGIITHIQGKQYAVVPETNGYLSVNVPWTDTQVRQVVADGSDDTNRAVLLSGFSNTETVEYLDSYTVQSKKIYANDVTGTITAPHFYNSTTSSSLDFIVGGITSLTEVD